MTSILSLLRLYMPESIGEVRCLRLKPKDKTHPSHSLFNLLPSGKKYRAVLCHTTRLQSSSLVQAVQTVKTFMTKLFCVKPVISVRISSVQVSHSVIPNGKLDLQSGTRQDSI